MRRERQWVAPAVIGLLCLVMGLASYEQSAIVGGLVPLFGMVIAWKQEKARRAQTLLRAFLLTGMCVAIVWLYWFLILSRAWVVGARGGLELNVHNLLVHRIPAIWSGIIWHTLGDWGLGGMWRCAFLLGFDQSTQDTLCLFTLGALIVSLIGVAASPTRAILGDRTSLASTRLLAGVFAIGIVLTLLAFAPAVVVRQQGIESRMLYFPWIGFTLAIAVLLEIVTRSLTWRAWWPARVLILSVGLVYLAGILTIAGFAHAYRFRWEHDQRQISALVKAVPILPQGTRVVLLPLHLDERSVSFATGKDNPLGKYLSGVFENPWSAVPAAQMVYKHPEVEAITSNPWDQLRVTKLYPAPGGNMDQIMINDRRVAISQLLAFTYENDRVVLVSPLVLVTSDGREVTIPLPLVEQVRTASMATVPMRTRLEPVVAALQ